MNTGFLTDSLIQLFCEGPKFFNELVDRTGFDRSFISYGLSQLQNAGVVEEVEYEVREAQKSLGWTIRRKYGFTKMWQDAYSSLKKEPYKD